MTDALSCTHCRSQFSSSFFRLRRAHSNAEVWLTFAQLDAMTELGHWSLEAFTCTELRKMTVAFIRRVHGHDTDEIPVWSCDDEK